MTTICLDTHVMLWGLRGAATAGQEQKVTEAQAFLERCRRKETTIVVPTVVLAELLTNIPVVQQEQFWRDVSSQFLVQPFDVPAAIVYGALSQPLFAARKRDMPTGEDPRPSRQTVKADVMVAATAIASGCEQLCTEDSALVRLASPHISTVSLQGS